MHRWRFAEGYERGRKAAEVLPDCVRDWSKYRVLLNREGMHQWRFAEGYERGRKAAEVLPDCVRDRNGSPQTAVGSEDYK